MVGSRIRDPEKTYSGSRIQGSKRHRVPDPGSGSATLLSIYKISILHLLSTLFVSLSLEHNTVLTGIAHLRRQFLFLYYLNFFFSFLCRVSVPASDPHFLSTWIQIRNWQHKRLFIVSWSCKNAKNQARDPNPHVFRNRGTWSASALNCWRSATPKCNVSDPKLVISDPDPTFQSITDPDPTTRSYRIRIRTRIQVKQKFRIRADPDPQHCLNVNVLYCCTQT